MTTPTSGRRASIIHGYGATPADHWFGRLAERLRQTGVPTTIPALPTPETPDPAEWTAAVRADVGTPDEGTVIVAHSLGCLTVLRYLRSLPSPWRLGALVLVAGFVDPLPALPELDAYIADGCDVEGLAAHVDRLTILRSDADPYVPTGHTDRLARLLGTTAEIVPGAGHFLASDGITDLPQALQALPGIGTSGTNGASGGTTSGAAATA
ncbi:RBBP9/YdeN family alpha/beta hydrolase [Actinomadura nitritigenes]|uniref:RBBP9/YdeN family alpha/beta hydrolase n=1 Tax=Actinomadura nitritigenes TaxID=134602 RepID=UPI0036CAFBF2